MKKLLLACLSFIYTISSAQKISPALHARLTDKTTLTEIMIEVESYYREEGKAEKKVEGGEPEFESNYAIWKRWEWWMKSHLDENGQFVNISKLNMHGLEQAEQKWGSMILDAPAVPQNRAMQEGEYRASQTNNAYGNWASFGPYSDGTGIGSFKGLGRIDRIAFHPSNQLIIYIGSPYGGVWKTINGGNSWSPITNSLPSQAVSGLVVSPTDGNVVYMLTGTSNYGSGLSFTYGASATSIGVFKTIDGGDTWTKTGDLYTGTETFIGHKLAISPTNGNRLIAATNRGLWLTNDGGATWSMVRDNNHWDVEFKPSNDQVIYASESRNVVYSTQGGISMSWETAIFNIPITASNRIELGVSPANPNYVYALCSNASPGAFTGLFRSTNSGANFSLRTNTPNILGNTKLGTDNADQSNYDLCIAVSPINADYLVTGGLTVWRSSGNNGGTTMQYASIFRETGGTADEYIHPDIQDIAYNPLNNYLYAATDGGIYRSVDHGVTWTNQSAGVSTTMFYRFSMRDSNADGEMEGFGLLGGAQDNGIKFRNNAGTFFHITCCDGYSTAIAVDDPNTLYINSNDAVSKSTDGGATQTTIIDDLNFFLSIALDWNNPLIVYIGGDTTRRSYDGFASINLASITNTQRVLTTCHSNTNRLYGSSGTNVIKTDNRIASWTTVSGNSGWPAGSLTVNDIRAQPVNSNNVFVCFGGYSAGNKVMISTNAGTGWTNWTGSLPNVPFYSLAVGSEGVYAGSEIGVFFRGFGWSDWVPYYSGMPRIPVTGLALTATGFVYASTYGRGMWFSSRRTDCLNNLTVSGPLDGPWYYQANNSISTTSTLTSGVGTEVFMHAGDSVVLRPGFNVLEGNFFKAYIAPCNLGNIPNLDRGIVKQVPLPVITELVPEKQPYAMAPGTIKTNEGKVEFTIAEHSNVEFLAKDEKGNWIEFYPPNEMQPGRYKLLLPAAAKEVQIKAGGKILSIE